MAALSGGADDLAHAETALREAEAAARQAADRRNALERRLAELGGLVRARAEEGVEERRDEVAGRLEEAEARAARWAAEARALARLRDALAVARTEARDRYLAPVTAELAPLVGLLLGDAALRLHPTRLLPQTLLRNGGEEELAALSGGTQEQIALLTRLAFARLLARTGRPIPVILDDPLAFADEARAAGMRAALEAVGAEVQIIVLTCRDAALRRAPGGTPAAPGRHRTGRAGRRRSRGNWLRCRRSAAGEARIRRSRRHARTAAETGYPCFLTKVKIRLIVSGFHFNRHGGSSHA